MNNINLLDKRICTGCRMCEQICPFEAIKIVKNAEGFIEPMIMQDKCKMCGLCAQNCPQLNSNKINAQMQVVYAVKNKNLEERKQSSSGGAFSVLANYVLDNNGIVYGCALNNDLLPEHIAISDKQELHKLRGSKYVQSDTKNTYKEARKDLNNGQIVLYSGTPCQIAGLKAFLDKEYKNLITIDLVCHGVPSPKLFRKYLDWLEQKYKAKVIQYEFRNKEKNGWGLTSKIIFSNNKIKYINASIDPYYNAFLKSDTYREVCYSCKYANENRVSDITLADYWGIQDKNIEFYDENGVSAVIINTKRGMEIFEKVLPKCDYVVSKISDVEEKNHNLKTPSMRSNIRNDIYNQLDKKEFKEFIKENLKFKPNLKDILKNLVPTALKKQIKKFIRK